jgi:hypothetical protein
VIAEVRDVDAGLVGGIHDGAALGHFQLLAVYFNLKHDSLIIQHSSFRIHK